MSPWNNIYTYIWLLIALINSVTPQNTGQGISLTLNPSNGKTTPGLDVNFICSVDISKVGDSLIVWSRKTGDINMVIAKGMQRMDDFVGHKRYKLSKRTDLKYITYTLTIVGAKYEDSGTFSCGFLGSIRKDTKTLAVCVDPSTKSCDCIVQSAGWASPECFGESKSNQELQSAFDTTVTGLGVCFAIAVIYGILITVFFARDCVRMIHKKKKRKELRRQMIGQGRGPNPYADSEKLTLDDDAASQPESGVWSQSEGSNNRNSGRNNQGSYSNRGNVTVHQGNPSGAENIARSRPQPSTQAHMNAAYDPEDGDDVTLEKPPRKVAAPPGPAANTGARPKTNAPYAPSVPNQLPTSMQPQPYSSTSPNQLPSTVPSGDEPPNYSSLKPYGNGPVPTPGSGPRTPRTPDLDRYSERSHPSPRTPDLDKYQDRPRLPSQAPPTSTQSEGRGRPQEHYHGDTRAAYTDVANRHGYHDSKSNYTEPRRLDFVKSSSGQPQSSDPYHQRGAYIDSHDTEI